MPPSDPLNDLSARINSAREKSDVLPPPAETGKNNAAERAGMRAGSELIGGILGGLLFGAAADYMFETRPYGLVIGLLLGVVAGFYGAYRYAAGTK